MLMFEGATFSLITVTSAERWQPISGAGPSARGSEAWQADGATGLRTKGGRAALLVGEKEAKTERALFKDRTPCASPAKLPIKETAVVLHYIPVYKFPSLTTISPTSTLMFSRSVFFLFKVSSSDLLPCNANRQWYSGAAATARESWACTWRSTLWSRDAIYLVWNWPRGKIYTSETDKLTTLETFLPPLPTASCLKIKNWPEHYIGGCATMWMISKGVPILPEALRRCELTSEQ